MNEPVVGRRRRRFDESVPRWAIGVVNVVVLAGGVGSLIHVPYLSIGPGPTRDVLTRIRVEGTQVFPSKGKILLTTAAVSSRTLTVWEYVGVWIDPAFGTIPARDVRDPTLTDAEQEAKNVFDIQQSKLEAALAVFRALERPVEQVDGALVQSVIDGAPAGSKLESGDIIVEIDGRTVAFDDVNTRLDRRRPGDPVEVLIERDGRRRSVRMRTMRGPDGTPAIGAFLAPVFDFTRKLDIETDDIVGPSAGLAFALSLYDLLTESDLTGGRVVAVPGAIDAQGNVLPIGAIGEKVRAAHRDGARIFVVPNAQAEAEAARDVAPREMQIIGVSTLTDAVEALRSLQVG